MEELALIPVRSRRVIAPSMVACALIALATLLTASPHPASAQQSVAITGDRLSGFVLPVEPQLGDIRLEAQKASTWSIDDTKRLVLEGDVRITIADHEFEAGNAIVWLNRLPSAGGVINQIAVFFDELGGSTRRAGVGVSGRQLLVTASARGRVTLDTWSRQSGRPRGSALLQLGEQRLADHLKRLLAVPPPLSRWPTYETPPEEQPFLPVPGGEPESDDPDLPETIELPSLEELTPWLRDPEGRVSYVAQRVTYTPGDDEDVILLTGSFVIEYIANVGANDFSQITLSAQRAVIFTDPGLVSGASSAQIGVEALRGVYLEGDVLASADDGDYVVRAPRMYYDFGRGQAIMLEAVLRTYMRDVRAPIYARAEEMRQIATNQWKANSVVVSTSEFRTPHLAIGAKRMTVTRRPVFADPDQKETYFTSEGNSILVGGAPLLTWPRFSGTLNDIPLARLTLGSRSNDGVRVETAWRLFPLLGIDAPTGVDAELKLDTFSKRGFAIGLEATYDNDLGRGRLDLYGMKDHGVDRTPAGLEVARPPGYRGVALLEHEADLDNDWTLQLQASYISDETFLPNWRPDDFQRRRTYETSLYLKQQRGNAATSVLGLWEINDFIPNDYLLASRGYTVDKLPELEARRLGESLFNGAVTYSSEFRVSRMKMVFERHSANQLGIRPGAFGIDPDTPLEMLLRSQGLNSSVVTRADMRHEFAMPMSLGNIKVVPFFVGRVTAYDDDFDTFSPQEDRRTRIFGAAGVRMAAQYQYVDNAVENRMFDLHRLRHVVEPSMTLWYGASPLSEDDLPEFDPEVESLGTGAAIRVGVRNVWQTQRGGPGRWRSVDVLTLDTNVVIDSNDTNMESPAAQFFDFRPEYSQFGDHFDGRLAWLLSDSMSINGFGLYDLEDSELERGSIGASLQHSPLFTSSLEYRYLRASDNELLGAWLTYLISPKYHASVGPQWDFAENKFRDVTARIRRAFPDFTLTALVRYDSIRDETTIGASLGLVEF